MPRTTRRREPLSEEGIDLDSFIKKKQRRRWKDVLSEIYNYSPHEYGLGKNGVNDEHGLAKKLKIQGQELMLSLSFLEDHGLIKYKEHNWIILTERGFSVALENERFRNNAKIQAMSIFVTLLLVVTAIFSFLNSTGLLDPRVLLLFYTLLLLASYVGVYRTFSK